MSPDGAAHVDATPTPEAGETHLQRGGRGRWALVDESGGFIEADAASFVGVRR